MVNTQKNKQFQETDDRIIAAYRQLRQTLPLEKIKIIHICQLANINRSSFYYHYIDIYDLNEKLIEKLNDALAEKMLAAGRSFLSRENLIIYFQHLKDEQQTYRLLVNAPVQFPIQRSYEAFKQYLLQKKKYAQQSAEVFELSLIYIHAGFHFMIRHWLASGCLQPIEEVVDLFLTELE